MKFSDINQYIKELQKDINALEKRPRVSPSERQPASDLGSALGNIASSYANLARALGDMNLSGLNSLVEKIKKFQNSLNIAPGQDRDLTDEEHLQYLYLIHNSNTFKELPTQLQTLRNFQLYLEMNNGDKKDTVSRAMTEFLGLPADLQTQAIFTALMHHSNKAILIRSMFNTLAANQKNQAQFLKYCEMPELELESLYWYTLLPLSVKNYLASLSPDAKHSAQDLFNEAYLKDADFRKKVSTFHFLPSFLKTPENFLNTALTRSLTDEQLSNTQTFLWLMPHYRQLEAHYKGKPFEPGFKQELEVYFQNVFSSLIKHPSARSINASCNLWISLDREQRGSFENLKSFFKLGTNALTTIAQRHHLDQLAFDKIVIADYLEKANTALAHRPDDHQNREIHDSLVGLKDHIDVMDKAKRKDKAQGVARITREICKEFSNHVASPQPNLRGFSEKVSALREKPENKAIIDQHASAFSRFLRAVYEGLQYLCFGYGFHSNAKRGGKVQTTTAVKIHQILSDQYGLRFSPSRR